MGFGLTIEVLVVSQLKKVPVPLRKSEILWLHCLSSRHSNRRIANQSRI